MAHGSRVKELLDATVCSPVYRDVGWPRLGVVGNKGKVGRKVNITTVQTIRREHCSCGRTLHLDRVDPHKACWFEGINLYANEQ